MDWSRQRCGLHLLQQVSGSSSESQLRVRGASVHGGVTYPYNGWLIDISVGKGTTVAQLNEDWELTHEMIHLAFHLPGQKPSLD